jgi:hypothetical protein
VPTTEKRLYALSLKQPWAALVVHGIKTIEVRRWPTRRRGRILIHAARIPDGREHGWELLPPEARATAELGGGIIGAADLLSCITYHDRERFVADRDSHLNAPEWFQPPCLYGFMLANAAPLPFRRFPGNVRFFTVPVAGTSADSVK